MSCSSQTTSTEEALWQRKQAIQNCIDWVNQHGSAASYEHATRLDQISFETTIADGGDGSGENDFTTKGSSNSSSSQTSYRPPMVGIYARQNIRRGDVLITIPEDCVLSEQNGRLRFLSSEMVDKAMRVYQEQVQSHSAELNPWDPFHKTQGRVLWQDELRLMLHLTCLLFARRRKPIENATSKLVEAAQHWKPYLDTLPDDYSSLIFHWTQEEVENLRGTSCHALVQRLRKEVRDNWETSFRDVLMDFLQNEDPSQDIDHELLHSCYMNAVCGVYSRMHGLETEDTVKGDNDNSRCTCPLVDLINGDREDSPRCNTILLQYPASHIALQASRDIMAGEELIFSYGAVSNQVFVTKFGFLPLKKNGEPKISELDVVHVLPPPNMVMSEDNPKWSVLSNARNGSTLERHHLIEKPPYISSERGTPFGLKGDEATIAQVRTTENWLPSYMTNFHVYAMTFLTDEEDLAASDDGMGPYISIEPWEPGALILEMIDYRLQEFEQKSMAVEKSLAQSQKGNIRTGTLHRMLEREILQMWRHAVAKHYDVYGEPDSQGKIFEPLESEHVCQTCQASLSGPLKSCARCKRAYYCGGMCQKEDWKAGHNLTCQG